MHACISQLLLTTLAVFTLGGCATVSLRSMDRPPSTALAAPQATRLGRQFLGLSKVHDRVLVDDGDTVAGDERLLQLDGHPNIEVRVFKPEAAFHLVVTGSAAGNPSLAWETEIDHHLVRYSREPSRGWWQNLGEKLIGFLPLHKEL